VAGGHPAAYLSVGVPRAFFSGESEQGLRRKDGRSNLHATGRAPISRELPYEWYNTPNIRVITLKDFRKFSREAGFRILKEADINTEHHEEDGKIITRFAGVLATYGIFLIGR
jgi:methionine biosynthesis protein MetW